MHLLSKDQINDLIHAVAMASSAIMNIYDCDDLGVQTKEDASPLTAADLASHDILVTELARICPSIPLISEEDATHAKLDVDQPFWLIDPLDGTKEFIKRNGQFTVNIGLISQKTPVFGIVAAPAMERVWVGDVINRKCFTIDDQGQRASIHTRLPLKEGLTVVGSKSHASDKEAAYLADKSIAKTTAVGSSLKFCLLAEGKADLYPRAGRTMEWDTAAGHAVLSAAGGRISNWDASPFTYTKPDFANDHGFIAHAN